MNSIRHKLSDFKKTFKNLLPNIFVSIMDARCVNCNKRADYNIEKNKIKCQNCGLEIDYDEYLEQMKEKATTLADNFQSSWDKTGY